MSVLWPLLNNEVLRVLAVQVVELPGARKQPFSKDWPVVNSSYADGCIVVIRQCSLRRSSESEPSNPCSFVPFIPSFFELYKQYASEPWVSRLLSNY